MTPHAPYGVGAGPVGRSRFRRLWNEVLAEVDLPGLRFHDLRPVGNTLAVTTGIGLKEPMTRIGHASTRAAPMKRS